MATHLLIPLLKRALTASLLFPLVAFADTNASHPPYPEEYESRGNVSPQYSDAATEALYWLTLLDQVQYAPSWSNGGPLLQDIISRSQWVAAMEKIRRPLGYVKARKVEAHTVEKSLPRGTLGYFMIIIYSTSFYGKSDAKEKVTLMFTEQKNWRVIAYDVA